FGIGILALCTVVLPAGIMSDETGMYRPILIGMYVPAIPFFFGIYQTLKLLHYIDTNKAFSELAVTAIKKIKYSAIVITALYTLGMPYIYYVADLDDAPGVILLGLVLILAPSIVATFAAVF